MYFRICDNGSRKGYRQYKSNPEDCAVCPLREVCFSKKQKQKVITHHVWEKYKDIARKNKLTATGKNCIKYAVQL